MYRTDTLKGEKYALDDFGYPADSLAARTGNQLHPGRFHSLASGDRPDTSGNSTSDWQADRGVRHLREEEANRSDGCPSQTLKGESMARLIDDFVGK